MDKARLIPAGALKRFAYEVLLSAGVRSDTARDVAEGLIQTSVRGVDSHGIRLLGHYLRGVAGGRINPKPRYIFRRTSASTGLLNADHTFGHAAGMEASRHAIKLAKKAGTGHVAVCNSTHFGAAAYYALEIAKHDMIGMAFTNTDALVKTYAGRRAFLGNNPIAFAAPCRDEEPFCLDMATSIVTFNKVRQWREQRVMAPAGVGADRMGRETNDPAKIFTLLPIGGYKGYGLSMMIEILCSLLTGAPYGPHIPKMFEASMGAKRFLGHFIIAMRIDCFQTRSVFKERMSLLINELRNEPRINPRIGVQVAGDPEKKVQRERMRRGIPLMKNEYDELQALGEEYGVKLMGHELRRGRKK